MVDYQKLGMIGAAVALGALAVDYYYQVPGTISDAVDIYRGERVVRNVTVVPVPPPLAEWERGSDFASAREVLNGSLLQVLKVFGEADGVPAPGWVDKANCSAGFVRFVSESEGNRWDFSYSSLDQSEQCHLHFEYAGVDGPAMLDGNMLIDNSLECPDDMVGVNFSVESEHSGAHVKANPRFCAPGLQDVFDKTGMPEVVGEARRICGEASN